MLFRFTKRFTLLGVLMGITADLKAANDKLDTVVTGVADIKTAIANMPGGDNTALTAAVTTLQDAVTGIATGITDIKATL